MLSEARRYAAAKKERADRYSANVPVIREIQESGVKAFPLPRGCNHELSDRLDSIHATRSDDFIKGRNRRDLYDGVTVSNRPAFSLDNRDAILAF
jgi:hypothetical protein